MTTHPPGPPKTPYDDDIIAALTPNGRETIEERRTLDQISFDLNLKRSGYRRALTDVQPRIDALVAALRALEQGQSGVSFCPSCFNYQESGHSKACQLAAALKLAGEPPSP